MGQRALGTATQRQAAYSRCAAAKKQESAKGRTWPSIWRRKSSQTTASSTISDTRVMGEAFDAAYKKLHSAGQPYNILATRIIAAAQKGERGPNQLRNAILAWFEIEGEMN
jgi:hypothetical protein